MLNEAASSRRTRRSVWFALASLLFAATASAVLAFAPINTSVEAVTVQSAGEGQPEATHGRVSHPSLLATQGRGVLIPLAIPVAIAGLGWAVRRQALGIAAVALLLSSIVGAASIGLFYVPAAALMAFAAGTRSDA